MNEYIDIEVDDLEVGYSGVPVLRMNRADRVRATVVCMPLLLEMKGIKSGHMHPGREQLIWGDGIHLFNLYENKKLGLDG